MNAPATVTSRGRVVVTEWRHRHRNGLSAMPADDLEHRPGVCESCDYYRALREQR